MEKHRQQTIREYPAVPAAVELAYVARYIFRQEFMFVDPTYMNKWVWSSPADYTPELRIVVPRAVINGRLVVHEEDVAIIDGMTECHAQITIKTANKIPDDPYMLDIVDAFRQYRHGRPVQKAVSPS